MAWTQGSSGKQWFNMGTCPFVIWLKGGRYELCSKDLNPKGENEGYKHICWFATLDEAQAWADNPATSALVLRIMRPDEQPDPPHSEAYPKQ